MATKSTKKKPTTKSMTSKKAPVARKPAVKRSKKTKDLTSFRASDEDTPFLTLAITRQTLYWGILSFIVLIMGLWIIHLQNEINKIYDAIDANQMSIDSTSYVIKKKV